MSHTKGPWKVVSARPVATGEDETFSVEGPPSDFMYLRNREDAALIASAPSLSARVEELEAALNQACDLLDLLECERSIRERYGDELKAVLGKAKKAPKVDAEPPSWPKHGEHWTDSSGIRWYVRERVESNHVPGFYMDMKSGDPVNDHLNRRQWWPDSAVQEDVDEKADQHSGGDAS